MWSCTVKRICRFECSGRIHNLFRRVSRDVPRIETGHVPPLSCKFDVSRVLVSTLRLLKPSRSETFFGIRRYYKLNDGNQFGHFEVFSACTRSVVLFDMVVNSERLM
jgi:hypothetical protein